MHFLWFSLKIRKDPLSEKEKGRRGPDCDEVFFHSSCNLGGGHIPTAAVIQRTCRSPRTTAERKHGSIILSAVCSEWWMRLGELSRYGKCDLVSAKVCDIELQRHAASPITLMDILSHDQLRLVEEQQFQWTATVPPPLPFL